MRLVTGDCTRISCAVSGWCRAELWCHLLSQKPDTGVILAHSCKDSCSCRFFVKSCAEDMLDMIVVLL